MADEVGDRVRFAGARRALHNDAPQRFQSMDDLPLLGIEREGEREFRFGRGRSWLRGGAGFWNRVPVRPYIGTDLDQRHQALRNVGPLLEIFEDLPVDAQQALLIAAAEDDGRGPANSGGADGRIERLQTIAIRSIARAQRVGERLE